VNHRPLHGVLRSDMNFESSDDPIVVAAAQGGDLAAFEVLVRRHTPAVYAHALRFFRDGSVAEDIVQEVFVKVFRSLDSFDARSQFTTWLFRITRNTCLDEIRAGRRRPVPVDPLDHPVLGDDFSDEVVLSAAVESAMATLAPEDRDALSAISVFGLSYDEAAKALSVPAGTVKSRVFRARRALAVQLGVTKGGA
jgi:RNA polymerase sigma-70 factor, ECF subfamily